MAWWPEMRRSRGCRALVCGVAHSCGVLADGAGCAGTLVRCACRIPSGPVARRPANRHNGRSGVCEWRWSYSDHRHSRPVSWENGCWFIRSLIAFEPLTVRTYSSRRRRGVRAGGQQWAGRAYRNSWTGRRNGRRARAEQRHPVQLGHRQPDRAVGVDGRRVGPVQPRVPDQGAGWPSGAGTAGRPGPGR